MYFSPVASDNHIVPQDDADDAGGMNSSRIYDNTLPRDDIYVLSQHLFSL
jgi:hypothetical protein